MQLIDLLGATAVKIIAIATLVGGTVGVMDNRHAKASDYSNLVNERKIERIEYYEDEINKAEDTINRIKVLGELNDYQKLHINQLTDRKAQYLRKIERINQSK